MPPPGSADSGSDDPASESSDTATSEPKSYLVMSGGEGYIDFRIGEYATCMCTCLCVGICILYKAFKNNISLKIHTKGCQRLDKKKPGVIKSPHVVQNEVE